MITKLWSFLFCLTLGVGLAGQALAWELNDSEEPGSVLVFHKFIRGSTHFEISATCPKDVAPCADQQAVRIHAHWVCPGDGSSVCAEIDFNLATTVNGTVVFDSNGVGAPVPPCDRGYLIAWVVDDSGNGIKFDSLIGDAVISTGPTSARAYNALPIQAAECLATGAVITAPNGPLNFDGANYKEVTGKIFGTVRYPSTAPTPIQTDLTLLTLDVHSNLANATTYVGLNFYNEDERLESTATNFKCWTEQSLTDIDQNLNAGFGQKGLVESTYAVQNDTGVTLVGILETSETVDVPVTAPAFALPPLVIDLPFFLPFDPNPFLPPGCRETLATVMPPRDVITCNITAPAHPFTFATVRDYAYSLYNDSTPVPTTFEPGAPPQ